MAKKSKNLISSLNPAIKAYIVSSIISFLTGFSMAFLADINNLSLASLSNGSLIGLIFVAIRAGIKYLLEDFLSRQAK